MQTGLLHLHGFLPFIFLLLMLVVLVQNFLVWKSDKAFTRSLARQNRIAVVLTHLQVTIGLIILFVYRRQLILDMGNLTSNKAIRETYLEHPVIMIIAAVLITIGSAKSKRGTTDAEKAKSVVVWFGSALVLIAYAMPWEKFLTRAGA